MTNNYSDYANCDMSVLTKRERQVVEKAIEGKKYKIIAEELGINTNTVGVMLNKARKKLEGNYENEREKIAARQKKYREKLDKTVLKEQK